MSLALLGRFEEALTEIRTAHQLDPLSPVIGSAVGRILHLARRFDEALEQYKLTRELLPRFAGVYWDQSMTYLRKGMFREAIASAEKYQELSGDPLAGPPGPWASSTRRWERRKKRANTCRNSSNSPRNAMFPRSTWLICMAGWAIETRPLKFLTKAMLSETATW